jgi:hypothetical protein
MAASTIPRGVLKAMSIYTGPSTANIVPSNCSGGEFFHIGNTHHWTSQLPVNTITAPIQNIIKPILLVPIVSAFISIALVVIIYLLEKIKAN